MITLHELFDDQIEKIREAGHRILSSPDYAPTYDSAGSAASELNDRVIALVNGSEPGFDPRYVRAAACGWVLFLVQGSLLAQLQQTERPAHPDDMPKVEA